jgi:H+/Na+-translocating ferredoxin:NAD+ oxidoreductase subunit G
MSQVPLTISAVEKEPGSLRLVMTLFMAGLISGLALAGVYQGTKPAIERNNARALQAAVYKVVPGSTQMQKLTLLEGDLVAVMDEATGGPMVIAAYDDAGAFVGYAIPAEGAGFQDTIRLIFGYDPARKQVIGMEVLESRETPGLGDKIIKDDDFVANFADLAVEPEIVLVKDGRANPNQVDAITGATISSRAVVNIINAANAAWLEALPAPELLPPLPEPVEAVPTDNTNEEDA